MTDAERIAELESQVIELTNLLASREADLAHVEGQTEGDD